MGKKFSDFCPEKNNGPKCTKTVGKNSEKSVQKMSLNYVAHNKMFLELATALLVIAQLVAQQLAQQPPLSPPAQLRHHHVPVANHTFASSNPYHNNVVGQLPQQRTFYYYYNQNYRYPCMSRCPYPYRWISSYNGHRSSSSAGVREKLWVLNL